MALGASLHHNSTSKSPYVVCIITFPLVFGSMNQIKILTVDIDATHTTLAISFVFLFKLHRHTSLVYLTSLLDTVSLSAVLYTF